MFILNEGRSKWQDKMMQYRQTPRPHYLLIHCNPEWVTFLLLAYPCWPRKEWTSVHMCVFVVCLPDWGSMSRCAAQMCIYPLNVPVLCGSLALYKLFTYLLTVHACRFLAVGSCWSDEVATEDVAWYSLFELRISFFRRARHACVLQRLQGACQYF